MTLDQSQWFDALGECRCGRKATGTLRGMRNESMGVYCERCASKRVKAAQKERDKAARAAKALYDETMSNP